MASDQSGPSTTMAPDGGDIREIWKEAISLYQETTHRDLESDPVLLNLHSTGDLLEQINTHEQKFTSFRHRKAKLWTILRRLMHGVEVIGKLTENVLTLTPFSCTSPILGAVLYLVTAAHGVSKAYDNITELLTQLANFTSRLEEYAKVPIDSKLRKKIVDILKTLLEIFARSEKIIEKGRFKQYFSVTFLNANEKVSQAMDHLRSLIDAETRLVGSLTHSTSIRIGEAVDRNERTLQKTEKTTERTERKLEGVVASTNESRRETLEKEEREMLGKVLDDKVLIKVFEKHDDVTDRRLSGTGDWMITEPLYQQWIQEESPMLWILGGPGAGKSFLSSKIISHLQEVYPQDPHRPSRISIAYFYIKEDDQQLRFANTILKVVALQLTANDSVFRNFAVDVCRSPENVATAKRTWDRLFMDFFRSRQSRDSAAFILIDGVDELPRKEQEIFLQLLYSLEQACSQVPVETPRLHFAMVGRPELRESISSTWDAQTIFIEVSAVKTSVDIENYIHKSVDRVKALKLRGIPHAERKKLRADIINKLKDGANGMFLWVNLMLDQIYNISRPSDIMSALNAAPQDLVKMIRHVFERIAADPSVNKADLNEILTWVTCAQQRLTLGEIDNILKMRPPVGEGMPDLEDRLRGQFASFFTLSRKDNLTTEELQLRLLEGRRERLLHEEDPEIDTTAKALSDSDGDDDDELLQAYDSPLDTTYLEFSHASVRDFLLQEGRPETQKWPTDLGVGVDVNKAELHITAILLDVLCNAEYDIIYPTNNLSSYAADYCLFHLLSLDQSVLKKSEKRMIVRLLLTIFHNDAILERWLLNVSDPYDKWVRHWLRDSSLSDRIRSWFADDSIGDEGFTSEEISQMKRAAESTSALFKPMAKFLARQWVGPDENDWESEFCVWLLYVYHSLVDCAGDKVPKLGISLDRLQLTDFPLACLRHLAEFGGFPKSSIWHRRFAKVSREAGYVNAALEGFDLSLSLNSQDPMTMRGIAKCFEVRKDYCKAIEWENKALSTWAKERKEDKAWSLQAIAMWRAKMGDRETAIQELREALGWLPEHPSILYNYIDLLNLESRLEEIMTLATELQGDLSNSKSEDTLCTLLKDPKAQEVLSRAAGILGKTEVIERSLENSLAVAEFDETEQVSEMAYYLTKFRWRYLCDDSQTIQLWEDLLEKIKTRTSEAAFSYVLKRTANALGQLYFDEAVTAESKGQDPTAWITKLENIIKPRKAGDLTEFNSRQTNVLHMGVWHRLHGRNEEAKACFRVRVLEAIDILTDEYPENDTYGFEVLAQVLHKAGDDDGTAVAISVPMALLNKLKSANKSSKEHVSRDLARQKAKDANQTGLDPPSENAQQVTDASDSFSPDSAAHANQDSDKVPSDCTEDHEPIDNFDSLDLEAQEKPSADDIALFTWRCDGECMRRAEEWQAIYACDVCLELCFCDQCVELVKSNKLGFRLCSPAHSFWQVYPSDERLLDVATEKVDGKTLPRAKWLEKLRGEWAV